MVVVEDSSRVEYHGPIVAIFGGLAHVAGAPVEYSIIRIIQRPFCGRYQKTGKSRGPPPPVMSHEQRCREGVAAVHLCSFAVFCDDCALQARRTWGTSNGSFRFLGSSLRFSTPPNSEARPWFLNSAKPPCRKPKLWSSAPKKWYADT